MFKAGRFKEGENNKVTMCLIDGIVSVESFVTLIKWLYRGRGHFQKDLIAAEMDAIPSLARDVLEQVKPVLNLNGWATRQQCSQGIRKAYAPSGVRFPEGHVSFQDPITETKVNYGRCEKSSLDKFDSDY